MKTRTFLSFLALAGSAVALYRTERIVSDFTKLQDEVVKLREHEGTTRANVTSKLTELTNQVNVLKQEVSDLENSNVDQPKIDQLVADIESTITDMDGIVQAPSPVPDSDPTGDGSLNDGGGDTGGTPNA